MRKSKQDTGWGGCFERICSLFSRATYLAQLGLAIRNFFFLDWFIAGGGVGFTVAENCKLISPFEL